jgi:hypothetical protein
MPQKRDVLRPAQAKMPRLYNDLSIPGIQRILTWTIFFWDATRHAGLLYVLYISLIYYCESWNKGVSCANNNAGSSLRLGWVDRCQSMFNEFISKY